MGAGGLPRFARKLIEATSATTRAAGAKPIPCARAVSRGIRAMRRFMSPLCETAPAGAVWFFSISEAVVDLGIYLTRVIEMRPAERLAVIDQQPPIGDIQHGQRGRESLSECLAD